jgi:mannose-6-phosphate isomerase-like protein (cupin superfamily)
MKRSWIPGLLVAAVLGISAVAGVDWPTAAYISSVDVQSALARQPSDHFARPLRVVDTGSAHVGVALIRRPQDWTDCKWTRLDQVAEVMRVISGSGTFVTGGELTKPQPVTPADTDSKLMGAAAVGSDIVGGDSRHLAAGDLVIIPAGVPHGFRTIDSDAIVLELVRVDTGSALALK